MRSAVTQGSGLSLEELIAKLVLPAVELRVVEVPQWRQLTVDEAWFKHSKPKPVKNENDEWDTIRTALRQVNSPAGCGCHVVCATPPHAGGGSDVSES